MKTIIIVALVLGFFSFIATGLYRLAIKHLNNNQSIDLDKKEDVVVPTKDSH